MASLFDYLEENKEFDYIKSYLFNYIKEERVNVLNTYDIFDMFQFFIVKRNISFKNINEEIKNDILEEIVLNLDMFKLSFSFDNRIFEVLLNEEIEYA